VGLPVVQQVARPAETRAARPADSRAETRAARPAETRADSRAARPAETRADSRAEAVQAHQRHICPPHKDLTRMACRPAMG
jgi:hypothetical protein